MQENTINATTQSERLIHLDILRGFALFGILLVNFQWFTRPLQAVYLGPDAALTGADFAVDWLITWLAEGKFYPLFAMLFGIGFTLMAERAGETGVGFGAAYGRRLLVLALMGLGHMAFIWSGDILLLYALSAVVMLIFFRLTPVQRLWKWALVLIGIPVLLTGIFALSSVIDPESITDMQEEMMQEKIELIADVERSGGVYGSGSFSEITGERLHSYWSYVSSNGFFLMLMIVGYFLLGRWLVESGRVTDLTAHRGFLRRWALAGLPLGLLLAALSTLLIYRGDLALLDQAVLLGGTLALIAGVIVPLGYLALVLLAAAKLAWLAPVGRMALSQYLLQSMVWTTVFYGYGLGLWGGIPQLWHPLLVVAFFALQIALSHWWLNRYRFGPAEWLWRSLTYWQWQRFKKLQ
ncbi:MAG TPA: DUF418 domain-containing protein [Cellvibrionaceae bacterium]